MKKKIFKGMMHLGLVLVAMAIMAGPSLAHTVNLVAQEFTQNIDPDGVGGLPTVPITMWGFAQNGGSPSTPGPRIIVPPGDTTLIINLTNNLSEPTSIVIPGLGLPAVTGGIPPGTVVDVGGRARLTSFTGQADAGGGIVQYTWTGVEPGTYLYHSGSHLTLQVHMGLYGALTVDSAAAINGTPPEAYPGVPYDNEVVLFYSEIDPELHDPPAMAYPNNYMPRYFLVNGEPYPTAIPIVDHPIQTNERVLVRILSAALDDLVPTINGINWDIIAEDGNPYPHPKTQYTALLSAMKTLDAIIVPDGEGTFPVFDRRLNLSNNGTAPGGMLVKLQVGTVAGAPVANPDSATVAEGDTVTLLDSAEASVLVNDAGMNLNALLVSGPSNAASFTLNADGTFSYTHNGSETTGDAFTYKAVDTVSTLQSSAATVTITVTPTNDPPVANPDSYEVAEDSTLNVAIPGVLENDSDPDGNPLTANLDTDVSAGTLLLNSDGSFSYTPATGTTSDSFTYFANDSFANSVLPAMVTITVTTAPAGPPVANDDFAMTVRNTAVPIEVLANDTDGNGDPVDPTDATLTVSQGARGGTVTILSTNSVVYTPRNNFRGTDTFTYSFSIGGISSNEATVTVNVVRE